MSNVAQIESILAFIDL